MRHKTLGIVALVGIVCISGCAQASEPEAEPSAPAKVQVMYDVITNDGKPSYLSKTGTMPASITIGTPGGASQADIDLPLKTKDGERGLRTEFTSGDHLYVSAQKGDYYGSITCQIWADGELISENTSSGEYAVATCSTVAP